MILTIKPRRRNCDWLFVLFQLLFADVATEIVVNVAAANVLGKSIFSTLSWITETLQQ